MLKKIAIGVVLLVALLAAGSYYLWSNLDSLIKAGVEKYGTVATQAAVHLDKVKLSLETGEGSLSGLSVGNPAGFSSAKALYLGSIALKVDTKSVTGTGPIVIDDITINQPEITYEMTTSGGSNLQTIAKNAQTYVNTLNGSKAAQQKAAPAPQPAAQEDNGRKIIINNLTVSGAQATITHPLLQGKPLQATLQPIHLTNIGKANGGASPVEVVQLLMSAISQNAAQAATANISKELGNIKGLGGNSVKTLEDAGGQLKGIFGK